MPAVSHFESFKFPVELDSHISTHTYWFRLIRSRHRGSGLGGSFRYVGRSRRLRFKLCFDGAKGTQRAEAHATTEVPPFGLVWLTQCPLFSLQQMKLVAENLKEEPREEGGKEKAT